MNLQNSRKKGKDLAPGQGGVGPGPWTAPADQGTRELTGEVTEDLGGKAEAKFESEPRSENERKGKAFHDAMISCPSTWWSV